MNRYPTRAFFEAAIRALSTEAEVPLVFGGDIHGDIGGAQMARIRRLLLRYRSSGAVIRSYIRKRG